MRYITDSNDQLLYVSFGADIFCNGQPCQAYTGDTPAEYDSLDAWYVAEVDKLYRWKVVDGQLTMNSTAKPPAPDKTIVPIGDGGTGATTADHALVNLGAAPRWELLWENAAPESNFQGQTLTIENLGYYDMFLVMYRVSTSEEWPNNPPPCLLYSAEGEAVYGVMHFTYSSGGSYYNRSRFFHITPNESTITFDDGVYGYSGASNVSYTACVPVYIFGARAIGTKTAATLGLGTLGKMILGKGS